MDFVVGGWLRPDEFTRYTNGDNFVRIDEIDEKEKKYKVTVFWDWEEGEFYDESYTSWEDEDVIASWDLYQPEDLIVSIFVGGVRW